MSTTETLKLELIEWLVKVQDPSLVLELAKWKEDHENVGSEQYTKQLNEADLIIDRGDLFTKNDEEA